MLTEQQETNLFEIIQNIINTAQKLLERIEIIEAKLREFEKGK